MLIILSPSKTISSTSNSYKDLSVPTFDTEAISINYQLQSMDRSQIIKLMKLSESLFEDVNFMLTSFLNAEVKPAIANYTGAVYTGFDHSSLSKSDSQYAEDHLRILSAYYGILKPFDGVRPYRLEMQASMKYDGQTLINYWKPKISQYLLAELSRFKNKIIINLASNEYFKVLDQKKLGMTQIVNFDFRDVVAGKEKFISYNAKLARGLMARYIVDTKPNHISEIRNFAKGGYQYSAERSTENNFVFLKYQ